MAHKELTGEGGKGSANRVKDQKKYADNWERIFKKGRKKVK